MIDLSNIEFAHKFILYFLLVIPVLVLWYIYMFRRKNYADITFSSIKGFGGFSSNFKIYLKHLLFALKMLALGFIIIALARPQTHSYLQDVNIEGIDLMIALDISTSMLAEDLKPNRLEAAKSVAIEFIEGRKNDRIGLVVFSGESFTQCPLTTDKKVLTELFKKVETGMVEDGTAIGDGLSTAVNRLRNSTAISKVIILLTDGVNNKGMIAPLSAADIAAEYNIRVYTIAVGKTGLAPYPFKNQFGATVYQDVDIPIDEKLLQEIAHKANGKYFRADNKNKLKEIYKDINDLEKTKIDVTEFKRNKEEFLPFLLIAFIFIIIEFLIRNLYLKTIP